MLRKETNRIVVHHSLSDFGSAEEIARWHAERDPPIIPIGYHLVIQRDGSKEIGRPLADVGAHCRGRNFDSVGVCFVGDFRRYEPSVEQLQSFYDYYVELHGIYRKRLVLDRHRIHDNPCPGPKFNWSDFKEIMMRI